MDGDDIALPDRLERQVAFLDRHPEVAVLGGSAILIGADGTPFLTASCPLHDSEIKAVLARSNPFTHSTVVMRRAALDAVGLYRPAAMHAENYLWLRMAECDEEGPPRWQPPVVTTGATTRRPRRHVVPRVGSVTPPRGCAADEPGG
jgi:hypothetical protein